MEFLSLSWEELHTTIHELSQKITASGTKYNLIVAIARGGMTPAHMLSDFLSLPVATFTVSSYKDMRRGDLSDISYHVGGQLNDKNILLVDDISDSGKTFIRGIGHLREMGAQNVSTASLFVKPWTKHMPDYFDRETDKWIVFPYEARETVEAIAKMMRTDGKTDGEIRAKLKEVKIADVFVEDYLKAQKSNDK